MRVLVLHSTYASGPASGENRVVEDEAALLQQAGHEVLRWEPEPPQGRVPRTLAAGVDSVWARAAVRAVRRVVHENAPDVVHVHNVFPWLSPAVLRIGRGAGPAVVMTLHNYRMLCLPATFLREGRQCEECFGASLLPGVRHRCYRGSLPGSAAVAASLTLHRRAGSYDAVDLFAAVSGFVRAKHVEAGVDPDRVVVKPNFAWPAPLRQGPGEHFLYLGRLSPEKGVDVLLAAWAGVPAPLLVVGDGPERARLERLAPSHVRFAGMLSPEAATAELARARALVLPSRCWEGGPRSVLEAGAAGVPVLATGHGAVPEFVTHQESGLLVEPEDPAGLAAAAGTLLDDATSVRLGAGAHRAWQARHSPAVAAADLAALYGRAVERATARTSGATAGPRR